MCFFVCYFVVFKHSTPLTLGVMATRGRNSHPSMSCLNYGAKDVMEATNFYNINVSDGEQVAIDVVEGGVKLIRAYEEDDKLEMKLEGIIPDLGCTCTKNSQFYKTLELYWHTKSMVTMGM